MALEKDFFRQVMGRFATGVTVVTAKSPQGVAGLTVNTFCSVSLNPPLILVCVDLNSQTLPYIRESGAYAVNMLTTEQEHLSRCFATSSQERYERFCDAEYTEAVTGSPILEGVLAFVDARVVAEYPGGDHVIFLGEVVAMGTAGQVAFANEADAKHAHILLAQSNGNEITVDQAPLAYYRGQYRHLTGDYTKPSLAAASHEVFERR